MDADAGLSTAIATSGDVASRLLGLGYTRNDGSRFERDGRTIDLLVEIAGSRFRPRDFDGGQSDGSPGLDLAIATEPIEIDTTVAYTDGHDERFLVRVPTVEWATVLRAVRAGDSRFTETGIGPGRFIELVREHIAPAG